MQLNQQLPMLNDQLIRQQWNQLQQQATAYLHMVEQGVISLKGKTMKLSHFKFGARPAKGYALVLGLHGGGGCTTPENDQQFQNHLHLYDQFMKDGTIWLVPRSCEEAWDMWFKQYLPEFFNIIIRGFVLNGVVNPNKVFITGYSAGGDGVYHLGPMLADWIAGAAMMAGHPNGVELYNLRNTAFSIQVGANDSAYDRNQMAKQYIQKMIQLGNKFGKFSTQYSNIIENCSHWMSCKDAQIFSSFLTSTRNPYPNLILFKQHDRYPRTHFYYLQVDPSEHKELLIVYQRGNQFHIESEFIPVGIYVNRYTVDFHKEVKIFHNGVLSICRRPERDYSIAAMTIRERMDPYYIFEDFFLSNPKKYRAPLQLNPERVVAEEEQALKSRIYGG